MYTSLQPVNIEPQFKILEKWALLWIFPLLAWTMKGQTNRLIRILLALSAAGLLTDVFMHIEWNNLHEFYFRRQEYSAPPVPMGLYTGLVLLGLIVFLPRMLDNWRKNHQSGYIIIPIWIFSFFLALTGFLTSQSRGNWLAFSIAILFVALVASFARRASLNLRSKGIYIITFVLIVALPVGIYTDKMIESRLMQQAETYPTLLTLDRDIIPYDSIGRRAHMWIYGISLWTKRPLTGYGIGSAEPLLKKDKDLSIHPHFHSIYIQTAVELGLAGAAFFLAALLISLIHLFRSYFMNHIPSDAFIFIIGAWTMVLVSGMAATRLFHSDGRFMMLMLTSITLAYGLKWIRSDDIQITKSQ